MRYINSLLLTTYLLTYKQFQQTLSGLMNNFGLLLSAHESTLSISAEHEWILSADSRYYQISVVRGRQSVSSLPAPTLRVIQITERLPVVDSQIETENRSLTTCTTLIYLIHILRKQCP